MCCEENKDETVMQRYTLASDTNLNIMAETEVLQILLRNPILEEISCKKYTG
jgi:hypothetical protein